MHDESEDSQTYRVVRNSEEQYSIWRNDREPPPGWDSIGVVGSKAECLDYIDKVWTDMRPLSLRRTMDSDAPLD